MHILESQHSDLASDRITHSVVMVDAAIAARWLERNTRNRPLQATTVARYKRDMLDNRWNFAGDPIRFSVEGSLLDGQHRLAAIVDAETVIVPMLVVRGLADETQGVMDQGRRRSGADQLALRGYRQASFLASSVRQYLIWESGLMFRDNKLAAMEVTVPWIEQWVGEHPEQVAFLSGITNLVRGSDAVPSSAGAAAIMFFTIDPEAAAEFFTLLARGAGTEGHPIVTLDKRLSKLRRDSTKIPPRDHLAMFIQAWNAWRSGRTMLKFQRPRGGAWSAVNYPVPR